MSEGSIEIATGVQIGSAEWPVMDCWEPADCHHERFPPGQWTCYGCGKRILNNRALPTPNPSTPLEPKHKGESPE